MPEDQIFGIRYGLRGFLDRHAKPVQLSRQTVDGIQLKGGTVLVGGRCAAQACWLRQAWEDLRPGGCGVAAPARGVMHPWGMPCF